MAMHDRLPQADWATALTMVVDGARGLGERRRRAEVVQMIRDLIGVLELQPGDRLPSERQLALRFGVSRGSVREAIQYLAFMGLVEVCHGGGSYLLPAPGKLADIHRSWHQWVRDHSGKVLETLELRLGTEAFAAGLAAQRAGPEDLERLVSSMQAMRNACAAPSIDTARFVECDIAFHDALLQAAGNRILSDLIRALAEELLPERAAVTSLDGRAIKTYEEHLAIYEAVRNGDPQGASEAMRRHIASVRQDVLSRLLDDLPGDGGATAGRPRG
jgi:GntR family transcriptional repressor for pyruvate dehydrogenase complex